jgi:hypothetical protein
MAALGPSGLTVSAPSGSSLVWVRLRDPQGGGTSRVPADRVAYYVAKGFRPVEAPAEGGGPRPLCPSCGFTAKDARGLAVHRARAHGEEREA